MRYRKPEPREEKSSVTPVFCWGKAEKGEEGRRAVSDPFFVFAASALESRVLTGVREE